MTDSEHVQIFNKRAEDYEGYSNWCKDEELYKLCTEPLRDMLPSIKCLDLGGGSGWIARKNALETGRDWTVFDVSPAMAKFAQPPVKFVLGDAHSLPFSDNEFGHVVIRSVLQFVKANIVLKQAHRVLTPRGHLVIAQKVKDYQGEALDWHKELFFLRNPTAPQDWTVEKLENSIKDTNFRLVATRFLKERRAVDLERWISKDGTISGDKLEHIRQLIMNPPSSVIKATNHAVENGKLLYDRTWAICYARRESTKSPLTPAVFSMIVEREVKGVKTILLQRRKKRYEEPVYCDSWELPQGKSEKGSFGRDTIAQELKDETNLELEKISEINSIHNIKDPIFHDQIEVIKPLICVRSTGGTDFLALAIVISASGNPNSIDIDRGYQWTSVKDLRRLLEGESVYPLNRPMIEAYLSTL